MRHIFIVSRLKYAVSSVYKTFNRPRRPTCSYQAYTQRVYSVKSDLLSLEDMYSEKDKSMILAHFNIKNEKNIVMKFAINEFQAKSIIEHRKNSGEFKTLSDILKVCNIEIDVLHIICEKILTSGKRDSPFYPNLKDEELSKVNWIVGFEIDVGGLAWTLLDRNLRVIDWKSLRFYGTHSFSHFGFKKKLEDLKECIPVADLYILANTSLRPSRNNMNNDLAITTLETMLLTLLHSLDYKVVRCKRNTMGNFFNLNVGNELTSGLFIMNEILNRQSKYKCEISSTSKKYFMSLAKYDQNRLTNSLLLSLTYHYSHILKFHDEDELSDEYYIERENSVDFSHKDCNISDNRANADPNVKSIVEPDVEPIVDLEVNPDVEPNTTVLRLGEKLKLIKEEALEKMSQPKEKQISKSICSMSSSANVTGEKTAKKRPSFDPGNIVLK